LVIFFPVNHWVILDMETVIIVFRVNKITVSEVEGGAPVGCGRFVIFPEESSDDIFFFRDRSDCDIVDIDPGSSVFEEEGDAYDIG